MTKITVVTDPNCNFQAIYLDGRLISDIGDNATSRIDQGYDSVGDMLEILFDQPEFNEVEYEDIGGYQLAEKIIGFDYVEYEGYWPKELSKVPLDTTDYAAMAEEALRTPEYTDDDIFF